MITNQAEQQAQYDNEKKSEGIAYALWFFLGVLGGHRFYAGNIGMGVGMLLTLGGLGIWTFIDVFFIGARIKSHNAEVRNRIFKNS